MTILSCPWEWLLFRVENFHHNHHTHPPPRYCRASFTTEVRLISVFRRVPECSKFVADKGSLVRFKFTEVCYTIKWTMQQFITVNDTSYIKSVKFKTSGRI
jgi:hypothetical protein